MYWCSADHTQDHQIVFVAGLSPLRVLLTYYFAIKELFCKTNKKNYTIFSTKNVQNPLKQKAKKNGERDLKQYNGLTDWVGTATIWFT